MNITETIIRRAAPYKAVAFDVFDTLLKRDVAKPTDLFALCGEEFARARVQAENEVRAAIHGEVTLAQIYAQPCMKAYDPAQECAMEMDAVVPNLPVLAAVRALQAKGKRLYYISDMYLPPEQISAMLKKCGYELDGGFVSCSYGIQKRSGGLFRRFLRETGLNAGQVLFIGDSWRADVMGAALAGIPAWHLPVMEKKTEETLESGAVRSFIENRISGDMTRAGKLGFSVLGPLEIGFCRWLHQRRLQHPEARIFFLARDMYLTREIYGMLYPEETTEYLQVSRRSLCPALLAEGNDSLLAAALPRQILTGQQIADYCGALCPPEYSEKKFNLKKRSSADLRTLLNALQANKNASLVLGYLQNAGIRQGDILVDIGSGGTTQMLLEHLCSIKLYGLQLSGDERLQERLSSDRVGVYLSLSQKETLLYWAGQPILERLISEDIGSVSGYRKQEKTFTVRRETQEPEKVIEEIQGGAKAFAHAWQASVLKNLVFSPKTAIHPFLQLMGNPTQEQLELMGPLTVEDGGTYTLAVPRPLHVYLCNPNAAVRDFRDARWKIGFMKRLLRWPLPYERIYLAMKK